MGTINCGKEGYPSRTKAEAHAQRRQRDNHTIVLRVYLCPDCGMWHMTHKADRFASHRGHKDEFEE